MKTILVLTVTLLALFSIVANLYGGLFGFLTLITIMLFYMLLVMTACYVENGGKLK